MDQDDDPALAETQSPALAARPAGDARAREVARAKIASALFAKHEVVKLGRYRLLDRVGEGGMGVVWGAYDPELERRVAIKLVRAKADSSRERILLEGQALAKLSHPNVVAVYDVGVVDDEVYLVMEWIRGKNLRVHLAAPRSVVEIVALFRAAGEGLYAAHRAGLVHRDFKPENVMIGDDGRVRVLDFGLALDREDGSDGNVAGTPRYMAPEQQRGDDVSDAVDQFAFGVSLREALAGRNADKREAPLPGWLAAIVERATAALPAERFASMAELLHALARDPATVWRRRILVGAAVVAAAGAFAIGSLRGSDAPAPCAGSRDELARVLNPAVQARLVAHGRTLGAYGLAEAPRLVADLTGYGDRWASAHRGACLAHRRGEVTTRLYERGLSCLGRARAAFAAVVDVLGRATVETLPKAVAASRSLPEPDRCMTDAVDSLVEPPAREIASVVDALSADAERARYLALAGDRRAVEVAEPVAAAAQRLGYRPLIARAELALGAALASGDTRAREAVSAFAASAAAALEASDDVLFVEAYAREVFSAGRTPPAELPAHARDHAAAIPLVEIIARRAGAPAAFARTLLYNNIGTSRLAAGDPSGAEQWFRKARDEVRAGARGDEAIVALGNLAMVVASSAEREQLFAEEQAALERALGPTHAITLDNRLRSASFIEHPQRALEQFKSVCAAFSTWYPHQKSRVARCHNELGLIADDLGDEVTARAAYEAVVATGFGDEARLAKAHLVLDEQPADADRMASEVAARAIAAEMWYSRFPIGVDALLVVAKARRQRGKPDLAIAALREALAILVDPRVNTKPGRYQRRLAYVKAELAMLLPPRQGATLADDALAWWRAVGGYESRIAALTAARGSR